jgi:hypothetical protein
MSTWSAVPPAPPGPKGNGDSYADSVSADGRFVVFDSAATNLSPDDSDGFTDVYVRDLQTNTTTLVSRAGGVSGAKGNGNSGAPAISADGRFVAFTSDATNLSPDDGDTTSDVYVRDLQTNTTTLVSRASGVAGAKGRLSFAPAISADGRFVAFYSFTRLSPDDGDGIWDVYVRDLQTEHDHARQPRQWGRRRQGQRQLVAARDLSRRALRRLQIRCYEFEPRRRRRDRGRVRARPAGEHDHARQSGDGTGGAKGDNPSETAAGRTGD